MEKILAPLLTQALGAYVKESCFSPEKVTCAFWDGTPRVEHWAVAVASATHRATAGCARQPARPHRVLSGYYARVCAAAVL